MIKLNNTSDFFYMKAWENMHFWYKIWLSTLYKKGTNNN